MIPKWTGKLVGKMHVESVSMGDLANKLGYHPKYVSAVLNGKRSPKHARTQFNEALEAIIDERRCGNEVTETESN